MKININDKYRQFLEKSEISEKDMDPRERLERERMFYGGFSQCFLIFANELMHLDSKEGVAAIGQIKDQLKAYWNDQTTKNGN